MIHGTEEIAGSVFSTSTTRQRVMLIGTTRWRVVLVSARESSGPDDCERVEFLPTGASGGLFQQTLASMASRLPTADVEQESAAQVPGPFATPAGRCSARICGKPCRVNPTRAEQPHRPPLDHKAFASLLRVPDKATHLLDRRPILDSPSPPRLRHGRTR